MPSQWMPGAKVMRGRRDGGSMTGGEKFVTWHYFVAPLSMSATAGAKYLITHGKEVHFTFNVKSGEIVQLLPAGRAGRGLRNKPGGVQTNRRGTVNFQVEVMANSPHWWKELTPEGLQGLTMLMAYFRSWGVPNQWAGRPGNSSDTPNGKSGHTGHHNWVENDHHDYLSKAPWDLIPKGAPSTEKKPSKVAVASGRTRGPFPLPKGHWYGVDDGSLDSHSGKRNQDKEAVRQIQAASGTSVDGLFGRNTERAVKAFQKRKGLTVDGLVGRNTWNAMGASR